MPRAERPLATGDSALLRFAADLRLLRQKAGNPTYRELAKRAHFSVTTLSSAANGRQLPSLNVALAYVRAHAAAMRRNGNSGGMKSRLSPRKPR
ncbi:helix-turn-helix domain-containing protein [Kibdelosporangium aridum]|uniref:helix-turn-helix domain-containing protein n=1 Tax=Kibdelosporangium aridum TaxID=2030 RepID=UPI0035EB44BD